MQLVTLPMAGCGWDRRSVTCGVLGVDVALLAVFLRPLCTFTADEVVAVAPAVAKAAAPDSATSSATHPAVLSSTTQGKRHTPQERRSLGVSAPRAPSTVKAMSRVSIKKVRCRGLRGLANPTPRAVSVLGRAHWSVAGWRFSGMSKQRLQGWNLRRRQPHRSAGDKKKSQNGGQPKFDRACGGVVVWFRPFCSNSVVALRSAEELSSIQTSLQFVVIGRSVYKLPRGHARTQARRRLARGGAPDDANVL